MREEDRARVDRVLAGDETAIEDLLATLERLAMGIACGQYRFDRADAEDIFARAFEKLWDDDRRALRRWNGRAPLEAYLVVIVNRLCLMELRRRRRTSELDAARERVLEAPSGPDPLEAQARRRALAAALDDLAPRDRELIEMRFARGLGYPEIVREIGSSYGAARKAVHVAVRRLRERMRSCAPELFARGTATDGPGGEGGNRAGGDRP